MGLKKILRRMRDMGLKRTLTRIREKTLARLNITDKVCVADEGIGRLWFLVNSDVERWRTQKFGEEREALQKFLSIIKETDVIFDIGASVGLYTIAVAVNFPKCRVIAFEPEPEMRARLAENTKLNRLTNVESFGWALGDKISEVTLFSDGLKGQAPSLRNYPGSATGSKNVSCQTLDAIVENGLAPAPDTLKIDIEGAELLCLQGARALLSGKLGKKPRNIFIELHTKLLLDYDCGSDQVKKLIEGFGYREQWIRSRNEQFHIWYSSSNLGEGPLGILS